MEARFTLVQFKWLVRLLSFIALVTSGYWLMVWLNGSGAALSSDLTSSGTLIMKTNMALAIVLLSSAVLLLGIRLKAARMLALIAAFIVFVIGSLTFLELILNLNFGIDELLAYEAPGAAGTSSPNRMGIPGSMSIILLSLAVLFKGRGWHKAAPFLGLVVCFINLTPAVGYLLNIDILFKEPNITAIAWPTLLCLMMLGCSVIFLEPVRGMKELILSDIPGDLLLRKLLPFILLVPLIVGYIIRNGERYQLYKSLTSTGILIVIMMMLLMISALWGRRIINRFYAAQKVSEDSLYESEEKYRLIFETANEGIWIVDARLNTLMVNLRMADMLGYSPEEIIGRSPLEFLYYEPDRDATLSFRDKIWTSNELRFLRKDGSILWVISNASPIFDRFGKRDRTVYMITDITRRKLAEIKLRDAQEKLNVALEGGNIGIWEWNLITNEMFWDERLEKIFGLKAGTFDKKYEKFLELVDEEDHALLDKAFKNATEYGLPYETIFRIKNTKKHISSKAVINHFAGNKPSGLTGVCFDITSMREETDNLVMKLNDELLRSNKELENFAYIASHDLQEPLRMVSGFTELLSKKYGEQLDETGRKYLHFASDGADRMYHLLFDLLAYSRIHTRQKEFTEVDTRKIVDDVITNLSLKIKESKAKIKVADLPVIYADASQMTQLFQNLLSNAIKFNDNIPVINISAKTEGMDYCFRIKDNGLGIDPQYFERIFQIFQRLWARDKYEGTGMGLAICKRIVERHGGVIGVKSEINKGSTFYFTIPRVPVNQ
jgi:PAS domain S-box-containing protein